MSIYQNRGATCPKCFWQEDAIKGDFTAKKQCKRCKNNNGRPGFDPKPGVLVNYFDAVGSNGKTIMVRQVVD